MITTTPSFTVEGSYFPTVNNNGTILSLSLQSDISLKTTNKYTLFVLDTSGSMSGSNINTSKDALAEMIKMLFQNDPNPKVDLITFTTKPTFLQLQGKTLQQCLEIISKISAGGGTCFIPVFSMILDLLEKNSSVRELAVVLLSDGQAEPLKEIQPHIESMKAFAEKRLSSAEFHTLGFGADHDARLLGEMTKSMPTQGTFQYMKTSAEIKTSIEGIAGFLVEKRLTSLVNFVFEGKTIESKVNFMAKRQKGVSEEKGYWEGLVCLNQSIEEFEKTKDNIQLKIKLDDNYLTFSIVPQFKKPEGKSIEMRQNCAFVNEELKKISDAIISSKFEEKQTEKYRDTVAGLRVMVNEIVKDVFKLPIEERKMVIESTRDLNEYMDKIGELLRASAKAGLTNDQIASINAMAYRGVTKKNNLKTLDKRALQNVELMNQVSKKAKEISEKLNEEEFNKKYKDLIEQVGCCSMSLANLSEALKGEDCLCITFDIGRPEVAIQDASRIIIKDIYPSIISASSFLEAVKYSMTLNPNNSGGFDAAFPADIVKGASNEKITAALPLYFCQEHWESASEYAKPILGWDVTIDPLGYDYNQLRTVPFLLLVKALKNKVENPNEFNRRVVEWIVETCCQIIRDEMKLNAESNLAQNVKSVWEKYETNGDVRDIDHVQNNNIFLAYVYCLQRMEILKADSQETFAKKFGYMIEEEMRRRQDKAKVWNGTQVAKNIKKILNLEMDSYIDTLRKEDDNAMQTEKPAEAVPEDGPKENVETKMKKFSNLFTEAQKAQSKKTKVQNKYEREAHNKAIAGKNKEKRLEKDTEFKLSAPGAFLAKLASLGLKSNSIFPEIDKLEKAQKDHANQAFQAFKYAANSLRHWVEIWGYENINLDQLQSIGIQSSPQLFTLYIQNKIHHKNVDRVESFVNKQYFDAWNSGQAEEYIYRLAAQLIYNKWQKELNSKPKEINCPHEDLAFFFETEDLKAAAGVLLKGFNLGAYEHLQEMIRKNPAGFKSAFKKLLMFSHDEYDGVPFNLEFKPRKKYTRQLFTKFKNQYTHQEWKELWFREKKGK